MDKGTLVFLGDAGAEPPRAKTTIKYIIGDTELNTLATTLTADFTDCVLWSRNFSVVTDTNNAPPGSDVDVDVKAVMVVKDTADSSIHKYSIPAPKAAIIELTSLGRRVTAAALASFVAALNTATGRTFVGVQGYIIEKK